MSVPTTLTFRMVEADKIEAFVDVRYGDFVIRGFKVIQTANGLWVAPPSRQFTDDEGKMRYVDVAYLHDRDRREAFQRFVLAAYAKERQAHPVQAFVRPDGTIALPVADPDAGPDPDRAPPHGA